jgi:hypothetical protein
MSVVVPILETTFKSDLNECMSLLFENTQSLPEDFYLVMMNLIKVYYEHRQNLNDIYRYLEQNRERVDPVLLSQIKSYIKPTTLKPVPKPRKQYDYLRLFKIIAVVLLLCIFPGGLVFVVVMNIIRK